MQVLQINRLKKFYTKQCRLLNPICTYMNPRAKIIYPTQSQNSNKIHIHELKCITLFLSFLCKYKTLRVTPEYTRSSIAKIEANSS